MKRPDFSARRLTIPAHRRFRPWCLHCSSESFDFTDITFLTINSTPFVAPRRWAAAWWGHGRDARPEHAPTQASRKVTYTTDDYLYAKQDDYLFHSFITPGDKVSDSPQVGHYAPKRHSHKHFNDTHFELFAYGKPLLIGPGKPGYVQDVGYKGGVFNGTTYLDQFFFNRHDYEDAGMAIPASGVSNDEVEVNASYPALFGHAEWEAPDYRPAYGVAPFHGTPYINFTHPTMYNLLAVGPGSGYYPKTAVREVDNPPLNAADLFGEAKVEFKGASATRAAALYKMHADSYDRYVLFARDRYYVIFDRINNTMWNNTAQHLHLRLHGQGTLALSTYPNSQSISYPLGTWTWKQDPTFADAAHTLTASNIHLLAYPAFANATRLTCTVDHEGRDPGVSDWDLNGSYRHNLYKHDVYDIQTVTDQRSMAVLLWPKNDQLAAVNPTVNWVDGNGYYTLTVSYNAEGQNFSDTWTFPVNTTLEHINNLLGLTPPSVPAVIAAGALTAASPSKGRIDLNWTYSGSADWFEITRSETGATGSWGTPRRVAGADRAFYDTNLDYGKTYYYKVRPINSRGWASWTSTVSATTLSS